VARIIELTTDPGDFVFDPFAGSGVVLAQAAEMNRAFFGMEVNSEYVTMYENSVIKAVSGEWQEIKNKRQKFEVSMKDFEQTIMCLRALKYSRQAIKAFIEPLKSDEISKILCAICFAEIPAEYEREKSINIELWFIGKNKHLFMKTGLDNARKRLARAPLSHYGISSTLASGKLDKFLEKRANLNKEKLFLYPIQKIREFSSVDLLSNWFQNDRILASRNGSSIPLLSNLEVNVSGVAD
jgi:hypothetical protein